MSTLYSVTLEDNDLVHPTSGFDCVSVNGGTMEVTTASKLVGNYGLEWTPAVGRYCFAEKYNEKTTRYRTRFYFKFNTFALTEGVYQNFFINYNWRSTFYVRFNLASGVYQIQTYMIADDRVTQHNGTKVAIADTSILHYAEIDWQASSAPGADDGHLSLWLDGGGVGKQSFQTNLDTDEQYITTMSLGNHGNCNAGVSGTMYFDDWVANNDGSEIGA